MSEEIEKVLAHFAAIGNSAVRNQVAKNPNTPPKTLKKASFKIGKDNLK